MKMINHYLLLFLVMITMTLNGQEVITDWQAYHQVTKFNDWRTDDEVIYVATDAGIFLLDRENYELVDHWTRTSAGLPSNRVEAVAIHPETQTKYIGTYDIGMAFQAEDETWHQMPYPDEWANVNNLRTYCLNFDAQNRLLVGTSNGLLRWEGEEWTIIQVSPEESPFLRSVWEMQKLADGEVVLGGHVIAQTDGDEIFISSPLDTFGQHALISYSDIRTHVSAAGELFAITDLGEMGVRDADGEWMIWSTLSGNNEFSFFGSEYIYEDEDGTIWVGLGWQGVAQFVGDGWELQEESPIPGLSPKHLYQGDEGLLIGAIDDVIYIMEDGVITQELPLGDNPWDGQLLRLHPDQNGQVWSTIGFYPNTSLVAPSTGEQWALESPDGQAIIFDFVFDLNNDLWAVSGSDLYQVSDWTVSNTYNYTNSMLPEASLRQVVYDGANNIWVGTYEDGMYVKTATGWQDVSLPANLSVIALIGKPDVPGVITSVYDESSLEIAVLAQTLNGFEVIARPSDWGRYNFSTLHYEEQSGRLWLGSIHDQLISLSAAGTYETLDLPEEWDVYDYVRRMGTHETGLWLMGQYQVAFYHNEEWFVYNSSNSFLDTERLTDAALDKDNVFWMFHNQSQIVEAAQTVLSLSTDLPELADIEAGHVFPNPATSYIQPAWEDRGTAYIVDLNGRVIREIAAVNSITPIFVSTLSPGSYWLLWSGEKEQRLAPFIKQ